MARRRLRWALGFVLAVTVGSGAAFYTSRATAGETSATPPVAPAGPPYSSPPDGRPPKAAYVVLGVAGAAAIAGTVLGLEALGQRRDFDNGDKTTGRVEKIEKTALLADMAFGAALALGITSAVLFARGTPSDGGRMAGPLFDSGFALAPVLTPSSAGAVARLQF